VAIAYKHVQERPAPPSQFVSDLPPGLEAVVMRLLAKNPDNRYRSAEDLRADLRRWLDGQATLAEQTPMPTVAPDATRVAVPAVAAAAAAAPPVAEHLDEHDIDPEDDEQRSGTGMFVAIFTVLLLILAGLGFWLWSSLRSDNDTAQVEVPRVINLPIADARSQLEKAGFAVDEQRQPNDTVPIDTVFDQKPDPGSMLAKGKTVVLTVSSGPAQLEIPSVAGRSRDDAMALLDDRGFNNVTVSEQDDDTVEAGTAIGTDPPFGQQAAAGAEIKLIISRGQNSTPIPNVTGKSLDSARAALTAAGFKVGNVVEQASETVPKDRVIGTDPDGAAPKGATINVLQSTGTAKVSVPSVIGQLESAATNAIESAGLLVEVHTRSVSSGDSNVGRVISVDPSVGSQVNPGSTVKITVGVATATTTSTAPSSSTTTTAGP